jgi:APA family basic amino acid/polyamine antiporter
VGYVIGVLCWANSFVSWAASSTLLASVLGFEGVWRQVAAAAVTLALGAVNYVGVRPGAFVVRAVVIGKVAAILCYLLVAVAAFDPARLGGELPLGLRGVGDGIFIALYPLQGFEVAPVAAGETKQAKSSVPFGTMGALLFSSALFVLVQLTMVGAYPGIAQKTDEPLVAAARHVSPTLGLVVLVGSVVSIAGFSAGQRPRHAALRAGHRAGGALARVARAHAPSSSSRPTWPSPSRPCSPWCWPRASTTGGSWASRT